MILYVHVHMINLASDGSPMCAFKKKKKNWNCGAVEADLHE